MDQVAILSVAILIVIELFATVRGLFTRKGDSEAPNLGQALSVAKIQAREPHRRPDR